MATHPEPAGPGPADIAGIVEVVAEAGRLLLANGHTTDDTVRRIEGLARAYGLQVTAVTAWSSLTLVRAPGTALVTLPVTPLGVNMRVVTAVLATVAAAGGPDGPPEPGVLRERLRTASTLRPYPTLVFAIAAATGATALAVIFGAVRPSSFVLIPLAAALGAVARRALGRRGVDLVGQAFAAALIAGLAGAASIVLDVTSPARLVAVCPAMVLVPGPHLLNGVLDLAAKRMSIGVGRVTYGSLIVLAICAGLLLGLVPAGPLPVTATSLSVPLWLDVVAAAVAAASYPVYFSLDARLIVWPVLVGALAHALRWVSMSQWGAGVAVGAFVACVVAGLLLTPVARRYGASFAGVGFAAVVALVPGVFVFRGVAGLFDLSVHATPEVVTAVAGDLSTGLVTLTAMGVGLAASHALAARLLRGKPSTRKTTTR